VFSVTEQESEEMMGVQRLRWVFLVATTVWAIVMGLEIGAYTRATTAWTNAPVIAGLELAPNADSLRDVLDQGDSEKNELWNIEVARANTWMDFLLIALYTSTFVLLAASGSRTWLWPVVITISLAGALDVFEDIRLFAALRATSAHAATVPLPYHVS